MDATRVADPWAEFRQAFLESFSGGSEVSRAYTDLQKLEMKDGEVNEYIGAFENLGLSRPFVENCLEYAKDCPKTFKDWCTLARRHQATDEYFKVLQAEKQMMNMDDNDDETIWPRNGSNTEHVQISAVSGRRECAADIGVNRRAITEGDKARYRSKGLCFECGKHGHLARKCPSRGLQVIA
ncbi:hypothetical protein EI94DRAFT_187283 [Lactarius quietus]|nr:hypothetical protein EI94DRAFT_187283 [Lactarius quietus]